MRRHDVDDVLRVEDLPAQILSVHENERRRVRGGKAS
jgi:hypothetical protein